MEVIKNRITVSFTKAEKEIIENFMSLTEQFSNICDKEDFEIFCRDCPFETFCNTFYNNADDVENFINRQINE